MSTDPSEASHAPRFLPSWAGHALAALGSALAFFVFPQLAPNRLSVDTEAIVLGVLVGLVLGVILRVPQSWAPTMAVGAVLGSASYFAVASHLEATNVVISVVIGGELWLMSAAVRRTGGWRLEDTRDLLAYAIPVMLVSALGGLVVVGLTWLAGLPTAASPADAWTIWVIDDVFGVVVITPAVLTLRRPRNLNWRAVVEWVIAASFSFYMTWFVFFTASSQRGLLDRAFFVALGSLWIAVRQGMRAVAPVLAIQYWMGAVATVNGTGIFAIEQETTLDRLLGYELLAIVLALVTQALAVLRDARVAANTSLLRSEQMLSAVVEGSPSVVFAKSYENEDATLGRYVLANDAWQEFSGLTREQTVGRSDAELWPEAVAESRMASDRLVLDSREALEYVVTRPDGGGQSQEYQAAKFPLLRADGTAWGVGVVATDVTDLSKARSEHAAQAELLHAIFDLSPTPAVRLKVVPGRGPVVMLGNAALARLLSCPEGDRHEALVDFVAPEDLELATGLVAAAVEDRVGPGDPDRRQRELRLRSHDDRDVWVVMHAAVIGSGSAEPEVVVQFEDITARRRAELALRDQATRDAVTGLPNRRALQERMQVAVERLRRRAGLVGVLFCDLDRFKDVNDSMGHQAGDVLLNEVAARLRAVVRPEDTVARLGGDEFVILAEDLRSEREAVILALRLQDRLAEIWRYEDRDFHPAMSVGIAVASGSDVGVDELLRRADLAMYRAKEGGRNRVEVYEAGIDQQVQAAVELQQDLRRAIDLDLLALAYQPIVDLNAGEQVGAEALVRLPRGDGTFRSPAEFVPQAEATGLIVPLGAWVVRQVFADLPRVFPHDNSGFVSVNVSAVQLRGEGFVSMLLDEIHSRGIRVSQLVVEVTETALIHDPEHSRRQLSRLHDAGIRVALDDFGTGYSSLSWLTRFPVDIVKIDRAFTADLGIDERKTSVVAAMISVSHDLGFSVVAEGVETEDQRDRLVDLGCDRGQGYLFGRPETLSPREAVPTLDG